MKQQAKQLPLAVRVAASAFNSIGYAMAGAITLHTFPLWMSSLLDQKENRSGLAETDLDVQLRGKEAGEVMRTLAGVALTAGGYYLLHRAGYDWTLFIPATTNIASAFAVDKLNQFYK